MTARVRPYLALCLAAAVLAVGCSSSSSPSAHVAKIGVVAPLDAGLVQFGRGIRNSVQLAIDQANRRDAVPGWKLEVVAADDSSNAATGEAAARRLAADPSVIGVVGTYNSGVAARVAPVLGGAGIVMVSPGNTDPALTLGADPGRPVRPQAGYFRMVAADNVQGPFLAKAAFEDVGARRVVVVSETKPVSKGLADSFATAFTARGGTVASRQVVPDGTSDYRELLSTAASLKPDVVFFGGEYDVGAPFTVQVSEAGITGPVMGGDGLKDDAYVVKAGPPSDGDLASTVGAPLASLTSARPFVEAYGKAGFVDPPSDFGAYAYDAANVIVAAAARALDGAGEVTPKVRAAVVSGVQGTDVGGASGRVAFDSFGDTRTKVLTLYRVSGGGWKATRTETVP